MTCQDYETALGEYVDGGLPGEPGFEAHLAACARCRATLDDLRTVRSAAQRLGPRELPPHLFPRIAAAIEARGRRQRLRGLVPPVLAWRSLAVAAVVFIVIGGTSWFAWRYMATNVTRDSASFDISRSGSVSELLQPPETGLVTAIADLEAVANAGAAHLDPETSSLLQRHLGVIDRAIHESRAALESEPASRVAQESLFDALDAKVTLLRDAVVLIGEMRSGALEEPASIIPELNP